MTTQEPRIETITDDLRTVYGRMQQLIVPAWLRLDLSMAQFKALVAVEHSSDIGVCGLGRELCIGESAASILVDQLVRRGYVWRRTDPCDRRRVLLGTTSRGEKQLRELRQGSREILDEWLTKLDEDQLDALERGLRALARVVSTDETCIDNDATTADQVARLLSAVIGETVKTADLRRVGERIWNVERLFNLGAGFGRADDTLPPRLLHEPVADGPSKGHIVDLEPMLDEYYDHRDWDVRGVPSKRKLRELELTQLSQGKSKMREMMGQPMFLP